MTFLHQSSFLLLFCTAKAFWFSATTRHRNWDHGDLSMLNEGAKRRRQNRELLTKPPIGNINSNSAFVTSPSHSSIIGGNEDDDIESPPSTTSRPSTYTVARPEQASSRFSPRLSSGSASSPAAFIQSLRLRSQAEDFDFDRAEREELDVLLRRHLPKLSKGELSSVIVSLGVCSHSGKRWSHNNSGNDDSMVDLLKESIMQASSQFSGKDAANVMVALSRMNWSWEGLHTTAGNLRDTSFLQFLQKILQNADAVEDQFVGDILYGIGALGARVEDLSPSLTRTLLSAFDTKANKFNSYSLSSALWSIAKIGLKLTDLPPSLREVIPARLLQLCSEMSPQQSSKAIWALGTLGFSYQDHYGQLLESFLTSIGSIKRSKMGSAVPASLTLVGMAKLGLTWEKISPLMKEGIWEQAIRVFQSTNDRGITNAIWALGTMDVPVSSLPQEVSSTMLTGIARAADDCSAWALCNIVWGLAKMKFDWLSLPVSFRQMLITNIVRLEADMNSLDVAILMWSLGSLDTPLDALPPSFTEALLRATLRNLEKMRPEELSKTIWGLSSTELSWDFLSPMFRWNINVALRRLGSHMAPQDVANCAYALAILTFDIKEPSDPAFRGAHEVMLNTIINNREKILTRLRNNPTCTLQGQELEQIRIYSHYLSSMRYVTDTNRIPAEFLEPTLSMNGAAQGSRLQNRVTKGLIDGFAATTQSTGESFDVQLEISHFGGVFPVDAAVSQRGDYIAFIEIDGPHHYRPCDGRLRRKDRMKEAMYRKALPDCTFHRVRWDDANKIGPDVVGEEVVAAVLSHSRSLSRGGAFLRSVTERVSGFFAWGLRNEDEGQF